MQWKLITLGADCH